MCYFEYDEGANEVLFNHVKFEHSNSNSFDAICPFVTCQKYYGKYSTFRRHYYEHLANLAKTPREFPPFTPGIH